MIIASDDNTATLWNVPSSPMIASTWPLYPSFVVEANGMDVRGTSFTGDGHHVITSSYDTNIRIWRVSDGGHVDTLQAKDPVRRTF